MEDLISIIVPVYKVEPYLDRCVQSLVSQTYQNLEIILVDDGSPDNCPAMCDAWAEKDDRIKVVHKKNGGLSDARNAGMAVATGELIGFVDSDDWIEPDMYQYLHQEIIDTNCEIVSGGVCRVWDDGRPSQQMTYHGNSFILDRKEAIESLIHETALIVPVWNKLYRREVLAGIPFPVGKINEDEFWSWRVVANADHIAIVPNVFYHYLQRSGSIMSNQILQHPMDAIEAKCQRDEYLSTEVPELLNCSRINLMYMCLYRAQILSKTQPKCVSKVYIKEIQQIVKNHQPNATYIRTLPIRQRLRYLMIQHCFRFTCEIQNLFHIGI